MGAFDSILALFAFALFTVPSTAPLPSPPSMYLPPPQNVESAAMAAGPSFCAVLSSATARQTGVNRFRSSIQTNTPARNAARQTTRTPARRSMVEAGGVVVEPEGSTETNPTPRYLELWGRLKCSRQSSVRVVSRTKTGKTCDHNL